MFAFLEMSFHLGTQICGHLIIYVAGDVLKNVYAVDGNNALHCLTAFKARIPVEFWLTVESEFPKFFEVILRASGALNALTNASYATTDSYQRAILNLSMIAAISYQEIVTLVGNGMGHGALRTLRTLLEIAINVEYFRIQPTEFDDYREWFWVERFKEVEYLRRFARCLEGA